jgi:hypothetical protein
MVPFAVIGALRALDLSAADRFGRLAEANQLPEIRTA